MRLDEQNYFQSSSITGCKRRCYSMFDVMRDFVVFTRKQHGPDNCVFSIGFLKKHFFMFRSGVYYRHCSTDWITFDEYQNNYFSGSSSYDLTPVQLNSVSNGIFIGRRYVGWTTWILGSEGSEECEFINYFGKNMSTNKSISMILMFHLDGKLSRQKLHVKNVEEISIILTDVWSFEKYTFCTLNTCLPTNNFLNCKIDNFCMFWISYKLDGLYYLKTLGKKNARKQ